MSQAYTMHPGEVETVTFDFSQRAEIIAGETIIAITLQPVVDPPDLSFGSGSIVGNKVLALLDATNGIDSENYRVWCMVQTNSVPSHRLVAGGIIKIRDMYEEP